MLIPAKAVIKNYTEISEVKTRLITLLFKVIEKEFTADNLGAVPKSIASVFETLINRLLKESQCSILDRSAVSLS